MRRKTYIVKVRLSDLEDRVFRIQSAKQDRTLAAFLRSAARAEIFRHKTTCKDLADLLEIDVKELVESLKKDRGDL